MSRQTMNKLQEITKQLELLIVECENDKADYYADNNSTDGYIMSVVGQIDGYKKAIVLIKQNMGIE